MKLSALSGEEKRLIKEIQRLMLALKDIHVHCKTIDEARERIDETLKSRIMVQGKVVPIR